MSTSSPPSLLAPHHLRLFAVIVDYLLIITVLKLVDQVALGQHWDLAAVPQDGIELSPLWVAGAVLLALGKDAVRGRSIGKWLTGIAVATSADPSHPPSPAKTLLRNLSLVILPVDAVLMFTDPYCRRLGDRLAGTVVVVTPQAAPPMRRLMVIAIIFLGFLLASFLVAPWNMKRSAAYQFAFRAASDSPQLRSAVGSPFELDSALTFQLRQHDQGGTASLTFEAEGPRGKRKMRIVLRMAMSPRRWVFDSATLLGEDAAEDSR